MFVHASGGGRLDHLEVLAPVNKAAMSTGEFKRKQKVKRYGI